jgi:predicted XRE-type DNA-binding protein
MSKLLPYIVGLLSGSLLIAILYLGYLQPNTQQVTDQTDSQTPMQASEGMHNDYQDRLIEQLKYMVQQSAVEQATISKQLETLQKAFQSHIEKIETQQYEEVTLGVDSEPDVFAETYQEPVTEQELRRHIVQSDFLQQEAIASQLDIEEVDPEWSSWAEAEIRAAFETNVDLSAQLANIVCLTTFCRVEGDFGDSDIRGGFISELMALVPWETQAFFHGDDLESATGVLYIMKEGVTELPN